MQRTYDDGRDDLAVYALSYDPVPTLNRFATSHGITFPLLSDETSAVITELGILNVTLEAERAAYGRKLEERHRGIPYPASFILDDDGTLVGKRIEQSHRIRPTASTLMTTFFGSDEPTPAEMVSTSSPGVQAAVWLDTAVVSANQIQDVHIRFVLEPDVHLYTDPVPDGFHALQVQLGGDDTVHAQDVAPLTGREFTVEGLDEVFHVLDGTFEITVPFFLLSNRDTAGEESRRVPVTVDITYQACTSDECFMPEAVTLDVELREEPNPGYETKDISALGPLVMRRIVEGPKSTEELLGLVNSALVDVEVDLADVRSTIDVLVGRKLVVAQNGLWAEA